MLAYTYSFGNGFSGTLSIEDKSAREAFVGSVVAGSYNAANTLVATTIGGVTSTSFQGTPGGVRFPDIVGNIRVDQPWGAAQLSAAGHQVNASLFAATALAGAATTYTFPAATTNGYGWAIQGGVQLNADFVAPGDKLWLQAAYEKGATSYIWGDNFSTSYGAINGNRYYGSGYTPMDTSNVGIPMFFPIACSPSVASASSSRAGS